MCKVMVKETTLCHGDCCLSGFLSELDEAKQRGFSSFRDGAKRYSNAVVVLVHRRMAGGYPADMAVKKNKFMEEWNGKREITEKTFKVGSEELPTFVITVLLIPYGIYTWTRSEFLNGTDRRYKDVV